MIKFREQVPSVYTNASRDFQYMSWLIDIVLNYVKHNVDDLYALPNITADPRLAELLAMTLGFKVKRNYDQKQLAGLVAILPRIIKCKGTIEAVTIAGQALIATSGSTGDIMCKVDGGVLEVTLPKTLVDISLFTDLLPYILPAGMTSRIIRTNILDKSYTTNVDYNDNLLAELIPDITWDYNTDTMSGLSSMFSAGEDGIAPIFSNFKDYKKVPNLGLLDNSIIAAVESPLGRELPASTKTETAGNKTAQALENEEN